MLNRGDEDITSSLLLIMITDFEPAVTEFELCVTFVNAFTAKSSVITALLLGTTIEKHCANGIKVYDRSFSNKRKINRAGDI